MQDEFLYFYKKCATQTFFCFLKFLPSAYYIFETNWFPSIENELVATTIS
jgi:predicted NAD-dependent protein-ADP-ribosyltransferase YbiA (DUF1768 family)